MTELISTNNTTDFKIDSEYKPPEVENGSGIPKCKLYPKRFFVLSMLTLALALNGEFWMNIPAVTTKFQQYFNRSSESDINWFSSIFYITFIIIAIPSSLAPQIFGLKWCIIIGVLLNTVCALLRVIAFAVKYEIMTIAYYLALCSNLFAALSQGFILNIPTLVSSRWFSLQETNSSTSACIMSNILGVALGFLTIGLPVGSYGLDIQKVSVTVSLIELVLCTVNLILSILYLDENPPTPPSIVATSSCDYSSKSFLSSMKDLYFDMLHVMKDSLSRILIVSFGLYYGVSFGFYTFLDEMNTNLFKFNSSNSPALGYIGFTAVLAGGISTTFFGILIQRYGKKKMKLISILMFAVSGLACLCMLILTEFNSTVMIFILILIYGCFAAPYLSIGVEAIYDSSHPIPANASSNLALLCGSIFGVIFVYFPGLIESSEIKCFTFMSVSMSGYALCAFVMCFKKFVDKRCLKITTTN